MRPVVDDPDPGPSVRRWQRCSGTHADLGHRDRREETLAGAQHSVRQEGRQLTQVLRSALNQVAQRLLRNTGRDRGGRHQLRVRAGLATQHHRRHSRTEDRSQALGPGRPPAEQPDHHQIHLDQQRGQVCHSDPGRIRAPVVRPAGLCRQQIGVRRRQEQNHVRPPVASGTTGGVLAGIRSMRGRSIASASQPATASPRRSRIVARLPRNTTRSAVAT